MDSRPSNAPLREAGKRRAREVVLSRHALTHCVICNYESRVDFDVCPKCKTKGRAVIVVRKG
jgi:hypothetical protein